MLGPQEAVAYVEQLDVLGMRFGLRRMRALLVELGDPHLGRPSLHVVGTNGKSSTARLAAAAFDSQGRTSGLYLSPHVDGWCERIAVEGRPVDAECFAAAVGAVRAAAGRLRLAPDDGVTQFEVLTAAAFWVFAEWGAQAVAVEAGLGGRYDATNVLAPHAAVALTNVALEHTDLLGDSEQAIAAEKLAVAADGARPVVVGPMPPAAQAAVAAVAARRSLGLERVGREIHAGVVEGLVSVRTPRGAYHGLPLPLLGGFQRANLAVALAGAELALGMPLEEAPLARALVGVRLPGRLELLAGRPPLLLDGAHNPAGMAALCAALPEVLGPRRTVAVVSVLGDKDVRGMAAPLARACDYVVATRSAHLRAVEPDRLADLVREAGAPAVAAPDPWGAIAEARRQAGSDGAVVVCGSLYLLADLRSTLVGGAEQGGPNPPAILARATPRPAAPSA